MLEIVIVFGFFVGAIYWLSEGNDPKYLKECGPFLETKKHKVGLSKVRFVRKRRV
jgi:hypothetical protein